MLGNRKLISDSLLDNYRLLLMVFAFDTQLAKALAGRFKIGNVSFEHGY